MSAMRDAQKAILTVARATWPDLLKFYEDLTAERLNWRTLMEQFEQSGGVSGVPRNYGVAVWFPATESDEWGIDGMMESRCDLFYIVSILEVGGDYRSVAAVREELATAGESMHDALKGLNEEMGILNVDIDASPANVANAFFLDRRIDLACTMVSVKFLFGV